MELKEALQTLLSAERAGVRVAAESLKATNLDPAQKKELERVHKGEAESCRILRELMVDLGITPTEDVGEFYNKAMKIEDVTDRLKLVDRGRLWVYNNLDALIAECDQAYIVKALKEVRKHHETPVLGG